MPLNFLKYKHKDTETVFQGPKKKKKFYSVIGWENKQQDF